MNAPAAAHERPEPGRYPAGSFLGALTDEERAELLRLARAKPFTAGQSLLRQGESGDQLLIVLRGFVKVLAHTGDDREVLLGLRGRGEPLGEGRYLRGGPRTATVVGACDGIVLRLDYAALEALVQHHPRVLVRLAHCVADRLDWADRRRTDFGLPVRARVGGLLHELALAQARERYGTDQVPEQVALTVPLTQRELGQLVGAAEVTVQKSLRELRRHGCLTPRYGQITVTRPTRLARLVAEWSGALPDDV